MLATKIAKQLQDPQKNANTLFLKIHSNKIGWQLRTSVDRCASFRCYCGQKMQLNGVLKTQEFNFNRHISHLRNKKRATTRPSSGPRFIKPLVCISKIMIHWQEHCEKMICIFSHRPLIYLLVDMIKEHKLGVEQSCR